jgi:hypothetical protein
MATVYTTQVQVRLRVTPTKYNPINFHTFVGRLGEIALDRKLVGPAVVFAVVAEPHDLYLTVHPNIDTSLQRLDDLATDIRAQLDEWFNDRTG